MPSSLVLVGAGKMGGAMLEGWLALGVAPGSVTVLDPYPSAEMKALCEAKGARLNPPTSEMRAPETLALAIKPQTFNAAAPEIARLVGVNTLVVSIMAGKTIANIRARLPAKAIVRAMPNTPAAVGRGVTAAAASAEVTAAQRALAHSMLTAIGRIEWVEDEKLIDAVTAVSGSGPAYVFYLAEALAKAGEAAGLPPGLAARLARSTVEGAGELMFRSADVPPSKLRENVTSPGGTTAAALAVLMGEEGLEPVLVKAVAAAKRRSEELSG
jgi:pyrroline-5-carboxylate reductase